MENEVKKKQKQTLNLYFQYVMANQNRQTKRTICLIYVFVSFCQRSWEEKRLPNDIFLVCFVAQTHWPRKHSIRIAQRTEVCQQSWASSGFFFQSASAIFFLWSAYNRTQKAVGDRWPLIRAHWTASSFSFATCGIAALWREGTTFPTTVTFNVERMLHQLYCMIEADGNGKSLSLSLTHTQIVHVYRFLVCLFSCGMRE